MNSLDSIAITGLRANAFHGVLDHERRTGQVFIVDLTIFFDASLAAESDSLSETVDYSGLAANVVAAVESDPVNLIETVAERVAQLVLLDPKVQRVAVTIHKPGAPINVPFDDVTVTITRGRG